MYIYIYNIYCKNKPIPCETTTASAAFFAPLLQSPAKRPFFKRPAQRESIFLTPPSSHSW